MFPLASMKPGFHDSDDESLRASRPSRKG